MSTDLSQVDVHPVVTGDKVAVVGLPILQLDQHRVVLRSAQQWQGQHPNILAGTFWNIAGVMELTDGTGQGTRFSDRKRAEVNLINARPHAQFEKILPNQLTGNACSPSSFGSNVWGIVWARNDLWRSTTFHAMLGGILRTKYTNYFHLSLLEDGLLKTTP